jgi:hypothetical protein
MPVNAHDDFDAFQPSDDSLDAASAQVGIQASRTM